MDTRTEMRFGMAISPFSVSATGLVVLLTGEWPWQPGPGASARDAAPRPAATLLLGFLDELERLAPAPR